MWEKVFSKRQEIVTRPILDEMILVPVSGNLADLQKVFTLNSVAQYVWEQLDGARTMADILNGVQENFEVDREIAASDIQKFMKDVIANELVTEN